MRSGALLGNQTSTLESQAAAELASRERIADRLGAIGWTTRRARRGIAGTRTTAGRTGGIRRSPAGTTERRQDAVHRSPPAARTPSRRTGARSSRRGAAAGRISLLEELEKRYEGLSPGVKDVLTLSRRRQTGRPWNRCLRAVGRPFPRECRGCPAGGGSLGRLRTARGRSVGPRLIDHLQQEPYRLSGRVGSPWLESPPIAQQVPSSPAPSEQNLEGRPGVLGRADRFIETEPDATKPLARRLLGRTWIVENLHARGVCPLVCAGLSFVTLAGEFLAADGTLIVGPRTLPAASFHGGASCGY